MVVPLGCLYSPLQRSSHLAVVPYEPVRCKTCAAVLNPYCHVDFRSKFWSCPFCLNRNAFPPQYTDISETNLPAELYGQYTTIEYAIPRPLAPPPVFLYVVDICIQKDELSALKSSLTQSLALLPENALVGLITFGTNVQVYELGFAECAKSFVFRGSKEYSMTQLQEMLSIRAATPPRGPIANKFIQPLSECQFSLEAILEQSLIDPWPIKPSSRPARCTGTALSIAVSLMELLYKGCSGRIMLFVGGPATVGPGQVVVMDLAVAMRSHSDIEKDTSAAGMVKPATKFCTLMGSRACENGHSIDVFAACLDQVGLHELRSAIHQTHGYIMIAESFKSEKFQRTFQKIFERVTSATVDHLGMAFGGHFEVQTSREWKVSGVVASCVGAGKKSSCVGETEVGYGGTCAWKLCSTSPQSCLAVYFEVANQQVEQLPPGSVGYVQFTTAYVLSTGHSRLRVATLARQLVVPIRLFLKSPPLSIRRSQPFSSRVSLCSGHIQRSRLTSSAG